MEGKTVDNVNIGLMIASAALAFTLPFELFLFSYAVLGPLHYITEIGWLHKKQYFTLSKNDYWIFVVLCALLMLLYFLPDIAQWSFIKPIFQNMSEQTLSQLNSTLPNWFAHLVFIAFASAVVVTLVKNFWVRLVVIAASVAVAIALQGNNLYNVVFATLLTTMIHVWMFTGMFILSGAMRSKSINGFISFGVFLVCSASFILFTPGLVHYGAKDYVMAVFDKSTFESVSRTIFSIFNAGDEKGMILQSSVGLKIQGFMAFAYTYHYLNWFSKTSVIKWHQVPKKWLAISAVVWIGSVGLYMLDYRIGLNALFFLSMLHVLLEFPLNYRTIMGFFSRSARVQPARQSR